MYKSASSPLPHPSSPEFWWDYLYAIGSVSLTLEGRQLNGKRNFNKRFNKAYPNAEPIPLNPSTDSYGQNFLGEVGMKSRGDMDEGLIAERDAINLARAFEHWGSDFPNSSGGILKEGDSVLLDLHTVQAFMKISLPFTSKSRPQHCQGTSSISQSAL